jgi:hypothetical protein
MVDARSAALTRRVRNRLGRTAVFPRQREREEDEMYIPIGLVVLILLIILLIYLL